MTGKTKRIQEDRKTRCHGEHRGEPTERKPNRKHEGINWEHTADPQKKKNEKGKSGREELSGNT